MEEDAGGAGSRRRGLVRGTGAAFVLLLSILRRGYWACVAVVVQSELSSSVCPGCGWCIRAVEALRAWPFLIL